MKIWTDLLNNFQENIPNSVECELKMMHSKSALTRFANSQIHQNVDEESADVYLTVHKDGKTLSRSKNITAIKSSKIYRRGFRFAGGESRRYYLGWANE
jgi:hypothetical protein